MPRRAFQDNEPSYGPTLSEIARTCGWLHNHCIALYTGALHGSYPFIIGWILIEIVGLCCLVNSLNLSHGVIYVHCHLKWVYHLIVSTWTFCSHPHSLLWQVSLEFFERCHCRVLERSCGVIQWSLEFWEEFRLMFRFCGLLPFCIRWSVFL